MRLSAALALLLAAPAAASTDVETLDYAMAGDVDTLDPHWAYDALSLFVADQVYETLIDFKGTSLDEYEPALASVVPTLQNAFISKDGTQYAFPLRSGVKFHDGTPMTADDVKYSLLRFMLLDRDGGPSALLLPELIGVHSTKDLPPDEIWARADKAVSVEGGAIVLRLRKPYAPLLGILANFAHVVPKAVVVANGGWDGRKETWLKHRDPAKEKSALYAKAVGTGPFRLVSWDKRAVRLERNDKYWRRQAGLANVNLLAVEDSRTRRRMLETREVDAAWVERRYLDQFANLPGVTVEDGLVALETQNTILFNLAVDPKDNLWIGTGKLGGGVTPDFFADAEIRKGLAMVFDYDAFVLEAFGGKAVVARGPIPPALFGHNQRQRPWPYSPYQAEAAFKRAKNGTVWEQGFMLTVAYTEGRSDRRIACRLLKEGAEKLNPKFRVDCRPMPESKLLDEFRAKRLPAFVYRWVLDYPDPDNAVQPFLHSKGFFASQLGYSNPRADVMIERAASELDPALRKALYYELTAMAIYDAPAIFTADSHNVAVRSSKFAGWTYHPIQPFGKLYDVIKLK